MSKYINPSKIGIYNKYFEEAYDEADEIKESRFCDGRLRSGACKYFLFRADEAGLANIYIEGSNLKLYVFDRTGFKIRESKVSIENILEVGVELEQRSLDKYLLVIKNEGSITQDYRMKLKVYKSRKDYNRMVKSKNIMMPEKTLDNSYLFDSL